MPESPVPPNRILIVEDDIALRTLLIRLLKLEGFEVLHASNGADALKAIELEKADALILDYQLPDMTGEELIATMRSQGFVSPVVLSTAHPNAQYIFQKIGAQGILMKPFDPFHLVTLLRSLLESRATSMKDSQ